MDELKYIIVVDKYSYSKANERSRIENTFTLSSVCRECHGIFNYRVVSQKFPKLCFPCTAKIERKRVYE